MKPIKPTQGAAMPATITKDEAGDIRHAVLSAASQSDWAPESLAESLIQAFAKIRAATSPAEEEPAE